MYVCELTKRRYRGKQPKAIRGPDDVVALVGPKFRKEQREHFLVLLLNARHEVLGKETVSIGSLNASIVHPREVFKPAVLQSAASIILVHYVIRHIMDVMCSASLCGLACQPSGQSRCRRRSARHK